MKKSIYSLLIILVISGCVIEPDPPEELEEPITEEEPEEEPNIDFDLYVTSWKMLYGTVIFNIVEINYEIVNLGNVEITYYDIRFEVSCTDWSSYEGKSNGSNLIPGETREGYTMVPIADKVARSIYVRIEKLYTR